MDYRGGGGGGGGGGAKGMLPPPLKLLGASPPAPRLPTPMPQKQKADKQSLV